MDVISRQEGNVLAAAVESPSTAAAENVTHPELRQVNEHIYAVHSPSERPPSVEMACFHGLQWHKSEEVHINTWLSEGGNLWLDWILEHSPDIFIGSYDAHIKTSSQMGRMDMFVSCENLLQCLIGEGARLGQHGSCPVVLIGHCIGGLMMKEFRDGCVLRVVRSMLREQKPSLAN